MIPFETTRHKRAHHIDYRRLARRLPSALMPFRSGSAAFARGARRMPRMATLTHRVVPVRNRTDMISVSTFIGSTASLFFFVQILMATIVPEYILFLSSISDENRGVTSLAHSPQSDRSRSVSSYRHPPKYRRPEKCSSIVVDATARVIEGRDDGARRSTKLVRGRRPSASTRYERCMNLNLIRC